MFDYEMLYHQLYGAIGGVLRTIEQEQQACEERCMQSDTPDYRAMYLHLFAVTEDIRHRLTLMK